MQNMPFDENPDQPVHVRVRERLQQRFDEELLMEIGISEQGMSPLFERRGQEANLCTLT